MSKVSVKTLFKKFNEKHLTISCCESFTGGLFANTLTDEPGSSKYFKGGIVAYSNEAKIKLVGVKARTIKKYGAVSIETSQQMAIYTKKLFKSKICVSFTGNADKNVMENKPPFFGYVTIIINDSIRTFELKTEQNKQMNRKLFKEIAINYAFSKISELLN